MFIESGTMADRTLASLDEGITKYTYRLNLGEDGALQWLYRSEGEIEATTAEPGATFWKNLVVGVTELLSIESQL